MSNKWSETEIDLLRGLMEQESVPGVKHTSGIIYEEWNVNVSYYNYYFNLFCIVIWCQIVLCHQLQLKYRH